MKVHYWNGNQQWTTACGKNTRGWRFRYWQQRKWKGVTCRNCLKRRPYGGKP